MQSNRVLAQASALLHTKYEAPAGAAVVSGIAAVGRGTYVDYYCFAATPAWQGTCE